MMALTHAERDEIAADARDALNNSAMKRLFVDLEQTYINTLKSSNVGDLTAATAHASLRVLEDVKQQLLNYSNKRF
jgi:hypothetical protein